MRKFYLSEKRVKLDISDKGLYEGFGINDIATLIVVVLPTIVIAIVVPFSLLKAIAKRKGKLIPIAFKSENYCCPNSWKSDKCIGSNRENNDLTYRNEG